MFFFYSFLCFVLLITPCFSFSIEHHLCSPSEASALLQLKQSFQNISDIGLFSLLCGRASFPKMTSWNESRDCCTWDGVSCDMLTGHVIGLDLSCSQLGGSIHPNSSLFQLRHLQTLNLAYNDFNYRFSIPHNIGRLTNLRHLNLSRSYFGRKIPTEISYLSKLVSLDLSHNYGCELDQRTFETMLHNFTNLVVLSLSDVNISSPIPVNISSSSLRYVDLVYTNLQGVLTESFFLLPNLENLNLSENYLLKGVLPKLHPSNILLELDISYTGISGDLPDSIGTLSSLNILNLKRCQFSGSIPDSIGNLTQIRELDLSYNNLTGHIPSTISKLKQLTSLVLFDNSFSGEIPEVFSNLQELWYLDLSNNNFIGPFPSTVLSLTQLEYLNLSNNSLSGPLPNNASMLQNLTSVNLSYNSLNGTIPSWVFSLPLIASLPLYNNQFSGLPNELKNNPTLTELYLSNNQLSGSFPQSLANLTNLSTLDLSSNNITGKIPQELKRLTFLKMLNLSQNLLVGRIPQGSQFNTFENDSYGGNIDLCGPPLSKQCDPSHVPQPLEYEEEEEESYFFSGFMWESVVIGYSFGLVVGTIVWSLMFKYREPKWFIEFFERNFPKKMRRPKKRARSEGQFVIV